MTWTQATAFAASAVAVGALTFAVVQAQEPLASLPNASVKATLGMRFEPAEVVIPAGGTVEWRNSAFFSDSVTDDPKLARTAGDARLPLGVSPFDSGSLGGGRTFRHTFTVPGRYVYFSRPHEGHRMVGVVTVVGRSAEG
jgi:plastocyanin